MALYLEKIAENEQKIQKLEKSIKRDTARKKKLTDENARLTYLSLCEQYNSSGRKLLDILTSEHEQAVKFDAAYMPVTENSSADYSANDVTDEQTFFFNEKNPYKD